MTRSLDKLADSSCLSHASISQNKDSVYKFTTFDWVIHLSRNTNAILYQQSHLMKVWLLLSLLLTLSATLSCELYLLELVELYSKNKTQFTKEVAAYVGLSGKIVDDLGLPQTCQKNPLYSYFTAQVLTEGTQNDYTAYLGVCFTSICTPADMNINGGLILDTLLNISVFNSSSSITFTQPKLEAQFSTGAIVFLILFILLVLVGLKEGIWSLAKGCIKQTRKEDEQLYNKYEIQFGQDYDPTLLVIKQKQGFFKKRCIFTKFAQYWTPEQSNKIVAFSVFRLLSIPLAFYGYLFYLCNFGSYNYFAFNKEIYLQSFSKVAMAAYYLPDTLFFISGFIFTKKAFTLIQIQNKPIKALINLFTRKVLRLYPLYLAIVFIYWQISPSLHAGPVWYEYQDQAAQCNRSWWHVFLLIDNWFSNGCYSFSWFIPVELQLTLINITILLIFAKNKKLGLVALGSAILTSWILDLTISSPLPTSLQTALSYGSQKFFKSTYSHLSFYLFGMLNAYFSVNQKFNGLLQSLTKINVLKIILKICGIIIIFFVVDRPEVWDNVLGFQLGLARTGMFLGLYLFLFWGMFGGTTNKTCLHKWTALSLGGLLMGGLVIASAFWSGQTFPYLDGKYLLSNTIPNVLIAMPIGALLAALIWVKPYRQQEVIL